MEANKATAKIVLTAHYDLNHEDIESIKNHLEGIIKWMMTQHGEPRDGVLTSWNCELEVEEVL